MKRNKRDLILALSGIVFVLSVIASLIAGIITTIYTFKHPELTQTELILWMIKDTLYWIPCVTMIISYIMMGIFKK